MYYAKYSASTSPLAFLYQGVQGILTCLCAAAGGAFRQKV